MDGSDVFYVAADKVSQPMGKISTDPLLLSFFNCSKARKMVSFYVSLFTILNLFFLLKRAVHFWVDFTA
jgi:hypothetical protein